MSAQIYLNLFQITSFVGGILVLLSAIGIWYFGNQVDNQKSAKINELIEGKNRLLDQSNEYLDDLRKKDAEIIKLKKKVSDMEPCLSILEKIPNKSNHNEIMLCLGALYPVDIRNIDVQIEFTSDVVKAERVVRGNGMVICNIRSPRTNGRIVTLSGGPLLASNHILLKVETSKRAEIKSHNLKEK